MIIFNSGTVTETAFYFLDKNISYEVGQKVPVYSEKNIVIGTATIIDIHDGFWIIDNGDRIIQNCVTFEFDENLKALDQKYISNISDDGTLYLWNQDFFAKSLEFTFKKITARD